MTNWCNTCERRLDVGSVTMKKQGGVRHICAKCVEIWVPYFKNEGWTVQRKG